jgi:hypothetical protein
MGKITANLLNDESVQKRFDSKILNKGSEMAEKAIISSLLKSTNLKLGEKTETPT